MPRIDTVSTTVYRFDELSEAAKEKARQWYREGALDYEWWDSIYESATTAAKMMGIDIDQINFTGFSSQGDGARFKGSYRFQKGWRKAIIAEFGGEWQGELLALGQALHEAQGPQFYHLVADISYSGRYEHSGCMSINVQHDDDQWRDLGWCEGAIQDGLRAFADWIYQKLEKEYDYLMADEQVDESIRANDYEFTKSGKRY